MDLKPTLIILGTGLFAGFINTVAGGGSLLSLPVLMFIGLPPTVANATNRVAILSQSISSVLGFRSKGVSTMPYGLHLGISALIGALIGAKFSVSLEEELFRKIIAGVMVLIVLLTIFQPFQSKAIEASEKMTPKHRRIGLITFFFIGIYGGFIQAGVGFLIMAALSGIHQMGMAKVNGIKAVVVFIYTLASLGVFLWEGAIDWPSGLVLALGMAAGGWLGSRWSVGKGDRYIKVFMLVMVLFMALKLAFPHLFSQWLHR